MKKHTPVDEQELYELWRQSTSSLTTEGDNRGNDTEVQMQIHESVATISFLHLENQQVSSEFSTDLELPVGQPTPRMIRETRTVPMFDHMQLMPGAENDPEREFEREFFEQHVKYICWTSSIILIQRWWRVRLAAERLFNINLNDLAPPESLLVLEGLEENDLMSEPTDECREFVHYAVEILKSDEMKSVMSGGTTSDGVDDYLCSKLNDYLQSKSVNVDIIVTSSVATELLVQWSQLAMTETSKTPSHCLLIKVRRVVRAIFEGNEKDLVSAHMHEYV